MFGSLTHFSVSLPPSEPPKNVPPPTPIHFPRCHPQVTDDAASVSTSTTTGERCCKQPLTRLLQTVVRPTEVTAEHFEALGVHVRPDATLADLIPDPSVIPDFATWDKTEYEAARSQNDQTRHPISNGNRSPGIQTYLDRKRELSIDNNAAYRSVRRIQPQQGQQLVRLGNAYEFFRQLESFTTFWEDTSITPPPPPTPRRPAANTSDPSGAPSSPSKAADTASSKTNGGEDGDGDVDSVSSASSAAVTDSEGKAPEKDSGPPEIRFYRSSTGSQMPPELRLNILSAFLKLIAYDFGCNVSPPRMEPRLYLNAGNLPLPEEGKEPVPPSKRKGLSSYFTSGCIFVFRMATTREAARAGIVEGPMAAVSARHSTSFPSDEDFVDGVLPWGEDKDGCIDLARELVAALLTAQQRARHGRAERRLGEGEWWATKRRWGGASGGPIGREVDAAPNTDEVVADRGEGSGTLSGAAGASSRGSGGSSGSSSRLGGGGFRGPGGASPGGIAGPALPSRSAAKKPRKGLAIYDNYRMVRPPSSNWDKKTRYEAIGRARGADYDDVFVVSALFHHLAIVRVRVPLRLLAVLDGEESEDELGKRSWGKLEVVRSPWYDFFKAEDRVAAMQLTWAMTAYLMRKQPDEEDVKMGEATA
ncbi:hypothetical protein CMQ_325 [Grosmannia clavigera kw1407]|uniref:Uncharacterized protein n=1 Tax=Grosmannia clavigera (strain kw1407 / UAMH 11150) TaxID=655863 RepID=F0XR76_GROCL|nr:uncharacterized protein CMQ_325 [Grosmannia clavigera kw1407]EFX00008.1 hypothetical protein CMQ_325 [Grosmannia clavigera kw1407]